MDLAQKLLIAGLLLQSEQDQALADHEKYRIVPLVVLAKQVKGFVFLAKLCAGDGKKSSSKFPFGVEVLLA